MGTDPRWIRFGMIAVQKGFVKASQVISALEIQFKENIRSENHRLIGEILVGEGDMTSLQVSEVLMEL